MSAPARLETKNRYAICVGVNSYAHLDRILPLRYAEDDARAVHTLLLCHGFTEENCRLLLGEQATGEAIQQALTTFLLTKPRRDDLVVFYFAGHGVPVSIPEEDEEEEDDPPSDVFLCAYDMNLHTVMNERGTWLRYPLRMQNLRQHFFEQTKSRKVLFIFDSCHSGDFFGAKYRPREVNTLATRYIEQPFGKDSTGRVVLSSCLPHQTSRETEQLKHGLFTHHLLQALAGRVRQAVRHDGWVTVGSLFEYLSDTLPQSQSPVRSGVEHETFRLLEYREYAQAAIDPAHLLQGNAEQSQRDKEHRLQALLADHSSFMRDRLASFVGRQAELQEIRKRITEKLPAGGYITITGQAGQGKSSIIAKLVEEYGPENVAYHFIPFNPGPDHQVGLLRNLMARLILKYQLSEIYVASESRPALRDYFPKVLGDLVAKGGQEVIFVDGLDQLEEESSGARDLSFLPNNPPPGVVFVLGTRPNDTLRPLELLKPHHEYKLPNLSRQDFDLILLHHKVQLDRDLRDQFYQAMQENALYLNLMAKELTEERTATTPQELIQRVANNPENIFSLSMERLKRQAMLWEKVLYPMLGLLLAAREPLTRRHIGQILGVEDYRCRDGLARLGGLVAEDGQQKCSLFHLKLHDYLRQDEGNPNKEYVFATHEVQDWHRCLANWCESGNLPIIWDEVKSNLAEQGKREYARRHYIVHLYSAGDWQRLFAVLDAEVYGQAKVLLDPSMRTYTQDLDLGRQATALEIWTMQEGIALLPRLWRYTLLRCSLASQADRYPLSAFRLLLLLKRDSEALGLTELLTDPAHKANVWLEIAKHMREQPAQEQDHFQILLRASQVAHTIKESWTRAKVLSELGETLARAQQWEEAERVWGVVQEVIDSIKDNQTRARALQELSAALVQTQQWEQAEKVSLSIEDGQIRARALQELATALAQAQHWEEAEKVSLFIEDGQIRARALRELGTALAQAQHWEEAERVWRMVQKVIDSIKDNQTRALALQELNTALVQAQHWEEAEKVSLSIEDGQIRAKALQELSTALAQAQHWEEAEKVSLSIEGDQTRALALRELSTALAQAQQWEQAERVSLSIDNSYIRALALQELATALVQTQQPEEAERVWGMVQEVIDSIKDNQARALALQELRVALVQTQQWEEAERVSLSIKDSQTRTRALQELATALTQAQHWEQAERIGRSIKGSYIQDKALRELSTALVQTQQWEEAERVSLSIKDSQTRARALQELSTALVQAQQWKEAERVSLSIEDNQIRAWTLQELRVALVRVQKWDQAQEVFRKIEWEEWNEERTKALQELRVALVQAQQWEHAQESIGLIDDNDERATALCELATEMAVSREYEQLLSLTKHSWWQVATKEYAFRLFSMATGFIALKPELGTAFYDAFKWVDDFLKG